ncbi:MAG: hypothetical protein SXA11_07770 [Cyanobacteriota bacterium]|nr:hypothetical protein [Cyanobacteriota bacterium]
MTKKLTVGGGNNGRSPEPTILNCFKFFRLMGQKDRGIGRPPATFVKY